MENININNNNHNDKIYINNNGFEKKTSKGYTEMYNQPIRSLMLKSGDTNWCEQFQKLKERELSTEPSEQLDRIEKLRRLVEDFAQEATQIGTTIISELWLPPEQKTIHPQTGTVGGIAGGEKFVQNGIFFKFAVDHKGLYGGDEFIMKSAGHEFLSLMELIDCRVKGLHFPLIVLVDYLGYRLIAESVLPLEYSNGFKEDDEKEGELVEKREKEKKRSSLILGSSDGGRTIHSGNQSMERSMQLISKILNLHPHYVKNNDKTKQTLVYTALDLEGHIGTDGRMYIIDTARVFPPEAPFEDEPKKKGSYLYRLLRPEFVKNNPVPLCSDAFSSFQLCARERFEEDIVQATTRLRNVIIPEIAKNMDANSASYMSLIDLREKFPAFINSLHRNGVNVRYLGYLRGFSHSMAVKGFILTEMVARAVKNILRAFLRNIKKPSILYYKQAVIQYFNLIFGRKKNTLPFWTGMLKDSISKRFYKALSKEESESSFDLRSRVQIIPLFQRLQDIFGLEFNSQLVDKFSVEENGPVSCKEIFTSSDLIAIKPIVKHMHRIAFEEATVLSQQAALEGKSELHNKLLELAEEKYEQCLRVKPDDYRALHNLGLSITTRAINQTNQVESNKLFEMAASKFQKALEINPKDAHSYLLWGNMLQEQSAKQSSQSKTSKYLQLSCTKYEKSYEIEKKNFQLLYNWGNALLYLAELNPSEHFLAAACQKFELALLNKKDDFKSKKNYGVALSRLSRLQKGVKAEKMFNEAQRQFRECSKIQPEDFETYFNWGNALYRHARLQEDKDTWKFSKLLEESSKRYLKALTVKPDHVDALYNWGKVLDLQWGVNEMPEKEHERLALATYSYAQVFKNVALKYPDLLDLRHLEALSQSRYPNVKIQAINLLRYISANCKGKLQEEANRYMSKIGINANQRPLSKSERDSLEVPELVASIVKRLFPQVEKGQNLTEMNTRIMPPENPDLHLFSYVDPTDDEMLSLGDSLKNSSKKKVGKYLDESTQETQDEESDD